MGEVLLTPTRLYVRQALAAIQAGGVHALAHITAVGLTENVPRFLPEGLGVEMDLDAWALPPVFDWLRAQGGMEQAEILKTFNCGIGMVLAVEADRADALTVLLTEAGETVTRLGCVTATEGVAYTGRLA